MKLNAKARNKIPSSKFGIPSKRKYPMQDREHQVRAKGRATEMERKGVISASTASAIKAKANRLMGHMNVANAKTHAGEARQFLMEPLNITGIDNGYKVDERIWRGAQPSDQAWTSLADLGVRTVIDLNNTGQSVTLQGLLAKMNNIVYCTMPWSDITPPSQRQIQQAIALMDGMPAPVFLHCQRGSDRTGVACACWRMFHSGWSLEDALEEALTAFGAKGLHEFWITCSVVEYAKSLER